MAPKLLSPLLVNTLVSVGSRVASALGGRAPCPAPVLVTATSLEQTSRVSSGPQAHHPSRLTPRFWPSGGPLSFLV